MVLVLNCRVLVFSFMWRLIQGGSQVVPGIFLQGFPRLIHSITQAHGSVPVVDSRVNIRGVCIINSGLNHYKMSMVPPQTPNRTPAPVQNSSRILQEVLAPAWSRGWNVPLVITDCTKQLERRFEVITNLTHRRQITTAVAVVRRTPDRHHILIVEVIFVSFVNQLVGTSNQRKVVDMAEFIGHSVSEKPS